MSAGGEWMSCRVACTLSVREWLGEGQMIIQGPLSTSRVYMRSEIDWLINRLTGMLWQTTVSFLVERLNGGWWYLGLYLTTMPQVYEGRTGTLCVETSQTKKDEYGSGRSRFKETGRDCIESQKWKREKEGRQLRLRERDKREREEKRKDQMRIETSLKRAKKEKIRNKED